MLKPGEGRDRQESVHQHTEAWCVNDQHGGSVRQHELLAQEGGPGVQGGHGGQHATCANAGLACGRQTYVRCNGRVGVENIHNYILQM